MKSNRSFFIFMTASALVSLTTGAHAQVGFSPESSPFRYIEAPRSVGLSTGYLWGDLGAAGVGPSNGLVVTATIDLRLSAALGVSVNAGMLTLKRTVLAPQEPPATRRVGEFRQSIAVADAGFELLLTGRKTWRGFAPYLGTSIGIGFGQAIPEEAEDFDLSTRFLFVPNFGTRVYVSDRFIVNIEVRDWIWRLSYPITYFAPADDGSPSVLDASVDRSKEWTHHFVLMIGLSYGMGF